VYNYNIIIRVVVMSDNVTFIHDIDDDDKTVLQTKQDLRKIELEIAGLTDDDTTDVDITHRMDQPGRPYWQEVFG